MVVVAADRRDVVEVVADAVEGVVAAPGAGGFAALVPGPVLVGSAALVAGVSVPPIKGGIVDVVPSDGLADLHAVAPRRAIMMRSTVRTRSLRWGRWVAER